MTIDPDTQKYYDDFFDMFGTEGWLRFIKDLNVSLSDNQRTAMTRCDSNDKWQLERGNQEIMTRIIN